MYGRIAREAIEDHYLLGYLDRGLFDVIVLVCWNHRWGWDLSAYV
jgi:hypothetical protein